MLGLKFWGLNHRENQAHFPKTMAILRAVPGLSLVAFSQLDPRSSIKPHNGDTNANIRCHLGLVVPGPLPELGFRVGTETRSWEEGKVGERERERWIPSPTQSHSPLPLPPPPTHPLFRS